MAHPAARSHPDRDEVVRHYPEFSRLLITRLNQLIPRGEEARAHLHEQVMTTPGDDADASVLDESADYFLKLTNDSEAEIQEVRAALDRVQHATYGVCEECGQTVSIERLRRVPTARFCIDCKSALEKNARRA
jgi:DnaK suppressor protein